MTAKNKVTKLRQTAAGILQGGEFDCEKYSKNELICILQEIQANVRSGGRQTKKTKTQPESTCENDKALFEKQCIIHALAEVNNAAIIIFCDQQLLYCNPAAIEISGYSRDDILQSGFLQTIIDSNVANIRHNGKTRNFIASFIDKSGRTRWANFQINRVAIDGLPAIIAIFFDVSEKINQHSSLSESEGKLRSFIEQSFEGMALTDEQGIILLWNKGMEHITGYDTSRAIGKSLWDIISRVNTSKDGQNDVFTRYSSGIKAMFEDGNTSVDRKMNEIIILRADGKRRIIQSQVFPIKTESGWMAGFIGRDITEIKHLQDEIKRQQQELETIFDSIPALIFFKDTNNRYLRVNRAFQEATGYSKEYFEQHPTTYDIAENRQFADSHCSDDRQVIQSGEPKYHIIKPLVSDKNKIYDIIKVPYRDTEGNIIGIIGFASEITEQFKAEKALRESQARYHSIFENSPIAVAEVDLSSLKSLIEKLHSQSIDDLEDYFLKNTKDTSVFMKYVRHIDINRAGIELFEAESKEDFLSNSQKIISALNLNRIQQEFVSLAQGKNNFEGISAQKTFKDKKIFTNLRLIIAPGYEDSWEKVYLSITDITEQVKAEERIKASLQEKEVMLRELHHRVKNNLQVIASLLSLQSSQVHDERDLELFKMSRERVRTMSLVHEKLYRSPNMARIDFEDYLQQLSHDLVQACSIYIDINLKVKVKKISLPIDQAIPCGLIVHELISNSLKYAFPDRKSGSILVHMESGKKFDLHKTITEYTLTVKDDGAGLPEHINLSQINTLGLQLVNILTRQLLGTLEILRENGTTFIIKFPQ